MKQKVVIVIILHFSWPVDGQTDNWVDGENRDIYPTDVLYDDFFSNDIYQR